MKKTPGVPNRGVEVTAITKCDRPTSPKPWRPFNTPGGDLDELAALKADEWSPTTDYFRIVGNTPNEKQNGMTELVNVATLQDLLNAIIGSPKPRPAGSIKQLNIIGHANNGLFALSSTYVLTGGKSPSTGTPTIHTDPKIFFDPAIQGKTYDLSSLGSTVIDKFIMSWLREDVDPNHPDDANELRRVELRDSARNAFSWDARIVFVMCHTAGSLSTELRGEFGKTFLVETAGWLETIVYNPDPNATAVAANRIDKQALVTSTGKDPLGKGYPCFVPVDASRRGDHLRRSMGVTAAPPRPTYRSPFHVPAPGGPSIPPGLPP